MRIRKIISKISRECFQYKEYLQNKEILKNNGALIGTKTGKTCFIIGNGPSLKDQDLKSLTNEETFVVNSFWLHPDYKTICPKHYVVVDTPHLYKTDPNRPVELFEENLIGCSSVVSQIPETKLFFSAMAKKYIEKNNLFVNNPKFYVLQQDFINQDLKFNMNPTRTMPFTKNVIILSIMLAIYIGFEEIYLLGCDHNFLAYPSNQSIDNYRHFYKEPPGSIPKNLKNATYEDIVIGAIKLFQNYRFLKEKVAKEYPRVKIYNATPNSFLDVFPIIKYGDIKL